MASQPGPAKSIHPAAYGKLAMALKSIYWFKADLKTFIYRRAKEHPDLLAGFNFDGYKWQTADEFVDRLMEREDRYRDLTLDIMLEVAGMQSFPELKRRPDAEALVAVAKEAVADLRAWTEGHQGLIKERESFGDELAARRATIAQRQSFDQRLVELKDRFMALEQDPNRQKAGRDLEPFLYQLFHLFDLEPRLSYDLEYEQIDGSMTFDTDDYIIEAKWSKKAIEAKHLYIFNEKVRRKGKNALGLFVSINGFTSGAKEAFREATSFLTMDGADLFFVLDGRVRLDELLRAKKRHANETGNCHYPAHLMLAQ